MRLFVTALLASALAIATVGVTVQPAEAGWQDGWYMFSGKTATKTRTFYERTPAKTKLVVALQKKAGAQKCRAQVIVKKGGRVWRSQYLYKYSRTRTNAYYGVIYWPNSYKRTTVTVKTNGRCIYAVAAR
jgi:hypothetical protein